jgi:dCTP deaminase
MTVLSKARLRHLLYETDSLEDRLVVMPVMDPEKQISEGSIDVRLGSYFVVTRSARVGGLDPFAKQRELNAYQETLYRPYGGELWIHPGTFVLGVTLEYLRLPSAVYGEVTTRSSWARMGLHIASAIAVHPGFAGCLTLELVNAGNTPIAISPGTRIGQIVFYEVIDPQPVTGRGKYFAQIVPQFALLSEEAPELERWKSLSKP